MRSRRTPAGTPPTDPMNAADSDRLRIVEGVG